MNRSMPASNSQTVDGCDILHHQTDGWNPIPSGKQTVRELENGPVETKIFPY